MAKNSNSATIETKTRDVVAFDVHVKRAYGEDDLAKLISDEYALGYALHSWQAVFRPGIKDLQYIAVFTRGQ